MQHKRTNSVFIWVMACWSTQSRITSYLGNIRERIENLSPNPEFFTVLCQWLANLVNIQAVVEFVKDVWKCCFTWPLCLASKVPQDKVSLYQIFILMLPAQDSMDKLRRGK